MPKEYSLDSAMSLWSELFGTYGYGRKIREAAASWPDARSVEISYRDLIRYSPNLAEFLLSRPHQAVYSAEEAALAGLPASLACPLSIRFVHLPNDIKAVAPRIRDIRSSHLGSLLRLQGIVRKRTEVRPMIQMAVFQCVRCGNVCEVEQDGLQLKEPLECYEDQGGCKRSASSTKFKLLMGPDSLDDPFEGPKDGAIVRYSQAEDFQVVELSEEADTLKGGEQPERLSIRLQGDLVGKLLPGERVVINGVLREEPRTVAGAKSTVFQLYLDALSLEREGEDEGEIVFEPDEIESFKAFANDENPIEKLTASLAPAIFGLDMEKQGLLLQLFGGVQKHLPDGTKIRGDVHVGICGEPGTAKSQLLRHMALIAPRAVLASGKSSSSAGLTAAAVKDGDTWVLEAGALVLGNGGLAILDELDKMDENVTDSLHEVMEQQTVSVNKAGIQAVLPARTTILGAFNPKFGRFDPHQPIIDQLDLPPALLSRFDLLFTIADKPNKEYDESMATHILATHQRGAKIAAGHNDKPLAQSPITTEFIKRYVRYARENVFPVLTEEASRRIREFYVEVRKQGEGESKAVPLTARQLEGFVRISEASAKARLSKTVELQDANRAIRLVDFYLRKIAGEGGALDIDVIAIGVSKAQREVARTLMNSIKQLDAGGGVLEDDVVNEAIRQGVDERKARDMLHRLREQGDVYQPDARHYKESPT